ncbi:MAG: shikimate dehydrogenase [Cyclobacteriaceae bacterium]|nr:shikimate dehydrogenase [Cyclobacteriaceae bacterium]
MNKLYGLIGYPLGHSFSQKHFANKFKNIGSSNTYELFELEDIQEFSTLIKANKLAGLNVTIPYKQSVIPFLDRLDKSAKLVGAVNVIKFIDGSLIGFNSDYPAFRTTLKKWLDNINIKALVLGTGGASKAVIAALNDLKIQHQQVSRTAKEGYITYQKLSDNLRWMEDYTLIINTTPVGMAPHTDTSPQIPYNRLTSLHYLYDLVYNPEETRFLKNGAKAGCKTKNGLEMLHLQAELAWDIWNA